MTDETLHEPVYRDEEAGRLERAAEPLDDVSAGLPPLIIRWRYRVLGGHVHVRVFAGRGWRDDVSLAKAGDLIFRDDEFREMRAGGLLDDFRIVPEDGD